MSQHSSGRWYKVRCSCPLIISNYNSFIGGVDLEDQAICDYFIGRKTMKWWHRVFWRLLDNGITNAYVIYKANKSKSLDKIKTNKMF